MRNRMLATLTIGQAPRTNITSIVEAATPRGVKCVHAGALDGLTRDEIGLRFAARGNGRKLVTRIADGTTVVLDKEAVGNALQEKIVSLDQRGCEAILLLCTGEFEGLSCTRARLFEPDKMLPAIIGALARSEKVGVVMPLREQIESEVAKWQILSTPALYAAASPYSDNIEELSIAARALRERGAQILVLDCMGYEQRHRARAAREAGCPVILSNTLVAKCVAEML